MPPAAKKRKTAPPPAREAALAAFPSPSSLTPAQKDTLIEELLLHKTNSSFTLNLWERVTKADSPKSLELLRMEGRVKDLKEEYRAAAWKAVEDWDKELEAEFDEKFGWDDDQRYERRENWEGEGPSRAEALRPFIASVLELSTAFPLPLPGPQLAFDLLLELIKEAVGDLSELPENESLWPVNDNDFSDDVDDAMLQIVEVRRKSQGKTWDAAKVMETLKRNEAVQWATQEWNSCDLKQTMSRLEEMIDDEED